MVMSEHRGEAHSAPTAAQGVSHWSCAIKSRWSELKGGLGLTIVALQPGKCNTVQ
jgi:hypothetical protein